MKKVLRIICMFCAMIIVTVGSYTLAVKGEETIFIEAEWYGGYNDYYVGYWANEPKVFYSDLSTSFSMRSFLYNTVNAWRAKGIDSSVTTAPTSASIMYYAGTIDQLWTAGFNYDESDYGLTVFEFEEVGNVNSLLFTLCELKDVMASTSKESKTISFPDPTASEEENANLPTYDYSERITVHEYGHALGWMGHSIMEDDVMYIHIQEGLSTESDITDDEANFLKGIYDAIENSGY